MIERIFDYDLTEKFFYLSATLKLRNFPWKQLIFFLKHPISNISLKQQSIIFSLRNTLIDEFSVKTTNFLFFPANAANPISRIFSENNAPTYKWFLWIRSKPDQWSLNSFMWIIHVYLFYVWNVEYWQIFLLYFHGFFSALVKIGSDTLMKMICIVGMISTKKIQTHLWQFCWGSDSAPMNNASHSRFVDVSWDDVTGELCLRFSSGPWGWILDKY